MARFPTREPDIVQLAHDVATGLTAHPEDFPSPPVSPDTIQERIAEYSAAREVAIAASAQAVLGTQEKDETLDILIDGLKTILRYAENTHRFDDGKLQLIGWGGRRARSPDEIPGQVRTLELIREGDDWVFLNWNQPSGGGQVTAYKIRRRKRDGGTWMDAGMSVETEVLLEDQEPGLEIEYHLIAVNKAGEGPPSNVVRAVL